MKKPIIILGLFALVQAVWANPIVVEHPQSIFLPPAIPLLIESVIIALGMKIKRLKFTSTVAFWFLITHLTYLPAQWIFDRISEDANMMRIILELAIVLIETIILVLWTKRKTNQLIIWYPLSLVFVANLISFLLGSSLVIGWK